MQERPIAAIATALAPSAVALIRTSGEGVIDLVASRFSRARSLRSAAGHTVVHGRLVDSGGRALDDVLITVFRAPRSYTGEECAEISCHGGPAGVRRVYAELLCAGLSAAGPGEFTRRAFLNGKLDLTQAEAVDDIVRAQTASAHAMALERLDGSVSRAMSEIRTDLVTLMAHLSIQLDYPEEETGPVNLDPVLLRAVTERVGAAARSFARGRLYQEGVRVAIAGRTNAGKSSLFNRIARQDRSIVSDTHGTTRDYLEALVDVRGVPVRLFDTAGLRTAREPIEEEGIRRSRQIISACDLVLYVIDAVEGFADNDLRSLSACDPVPTIVVWNKVDAPGASPVGDGEWFPPAGSRATERNVIATSALTGAGVDELLDRVFDRVAGASGAGASGVTIDSERQRALLLRAEEALGHVANSIDAGVPADMVAVDLQDALDAIGEISGDVASAEILDAMFAGFCVGK